MVLVVLNLWPSNGAVKVAWGFRLVREKVMLGKVGIQRDGLAYFLVVVGEE